MTNDDRIPRVDPFWMADEHLVMLYATPLGPWGLEQAASTMQNMLDLCFTKRNELAVRIEKPDHSDQYLDLNAEVFDLGFVYAACSHIAAASLAPLFETLIHRVAQRFREAIGRTCFCLNDHRRSRWPDDDYWNPAKYCDENGEGKISLVAGFGQLLKAIGQQRVVVRPSWAYIEALFAYRNKSLHHGYEWPLDAQDKFRKRFNKQWKIWFEEIATGETDIYRSSLIGVTDAFVQTGFETLSSLAGTLRRAVIEARAADHPPTGRSGRAGGRTSGPG